MRAYLERGITFDWLIPHQLNLGGIMAPVCKKAAVPWEKLVIPHIMPLKHLEMWVITSRARLTRRPLTSRAASLRILPSTFTAPAVSAASLPALPAAGTGRDRRGAPASLHDHLSVGTVCGDAGLPGAIAPGGGVITIAERERLHQSYAQVDDAGVSFASMHLMLAVGRKDGG